VLSLEDLKAYFQITKVNKAPAKFDEAKFEFFNG